MNRHLFVHAVRCPTWVLMTGSQSHKERLFIYRVVYLWKEGRGEREVETQK